MAWFEKTLRALVERAKQQPFAVASFAWQIVRFLLEHRHR